MEYEDEAIDRRILIRYAGDAKFKGVRSSLPVYEVELRGAGASAWSGSSRRGGWPT